MDWTVIAQYGIAGAILFLIVKPWVENVQARNFEMQRQLLSMHQKALEEICEHQQAVGESTKMYLQDISKSLNNIAGEQAAMTKVWSDGHCPRDLKKEEIAP